MRTLFICNVFVWTAFIWTGFCLTLCRPACGDDPDILIADFEGKDYGQWVATGEAFGPGPAPGTLPDQMEVSGYEGKGLVNSFLRRGRHHRVAHQPTVHDPTKTTSTS